MANWLHRETTWRGPLRWRIRQAIWVLFNGEFNFSVDYKFGEDGVSAWVDDHKIMQMPTPNSEAGDK